MVRERAEAQVEAHFQEATVLACSWVVAHGATSVTSQATVTRTRRVLT